MLSTAPSLARRAHKPPDALTLWGEVSLTLARVHELCGRARRTLALQLANATEGPVIWIGPAWRSEALIPDGIAPLIAPGRMTFVAPDREDDMLWCMEETLRAGCVPVVIAEVSAPPALTPVRRLHLAAEAGAGQGLCRPLGLLLTPDAGGAPGVETRWQMDPAHTSESECWRLTRLRARMAPPVTWQVSGNTLRRDTHPTPTMAAE